MTLFYTDEQGTVILHREAVNLCPQLKALSDEEVLFVILAYDYFSLYRRFNQEEKIRKAMIHVYGDNEYDILKKPEVKAGIEAYKSLQYDSRQEDIAVYEQKIEELRERIVDETAANTIKSYMDTIARLRSEISKLNLEITEDVQKEESLEGDAKLSFIEKMMASQKRYNAIIAKRA